MSMSSEQAQEYLNKLKNTSTANTVADTTSNEAVTPTESNEVESKSEEVNVASPDNATKTEIDQPNNDNQSNDDNATGNDTESGESESKKVTESNQIDENKSKSKDKSKLSHKDKRDYAFVRTSQQLKEAKKQIKELTSALEKYKDLQSKDFKDKSGNPDYDAYTNWKLQERDMQNEVQRLQREQLDVELEQDRIATERCFDTQELEEYNNLIASKGKVFADVIHSYDENNAVFKYLDTVNDYPIVLKELMTNHNKWLPQIFRTNKYSQAVISDPVTLQRNTARVAEQILDEYYASKNKSVEQSNKTAIPVIGKQISNNNVSDSSVHDRNYWNNHLRQLPKG